MPHTTTAPRSATEAAHQLAADGHHVHIVSEQHSTCLADRCGPAPLQLPTATRQRAEAVRLSLTRGIERI